MNLTLRLLARRAARPVSLLAPVLMLTAAAPAGAAVVWDESINGDFSGNGLAPSFVALSAGSNVIRGQSGRTVAGGPIDLDYFTFTVPAGYVLDAMEILPGTASVGDGSFIGLMAGSTFTVSPTTGSAAGLLGWTLFGGGNVGGDLLLYMATPSFGSTGFTAPLPAGNYAFWVQENGVGTATYGFDLSVTAVPEPASALTLLGGLALLAAARKRR